MKSRTKVILASTLATVLGSTALIGISTADQDGQGRHGYRHYEDNDGYGKGRGDGHGPRHAHHRRHHGDDAGARGYQRDGGGRRMARLLEQYDSDGDGKLTQAEIDQVRNDRLAKFDSNGDGKLSLEEYQVLWLERMHSRMVDEFQELDEDGDALVTGEEYLAPFAKFEQRMEQRMERRMENMERSMEQRMQQRMQQRMERHMERMEHHRQDGANSPDTAPADDAETAPTATE
jgi:hypothetical protein